MRQHETGIDELDLRLPPGHGTDNLSPDGEVVYVSRSEMKTGLFWLLVTGSTSGLLFPFLGVGALSRWTLLWVLPLLLVITTFRKMSATVTTEVVHVEFGLRFPWKTIPLDQITEVATSTVPAIFGHGVRIVEGGMLWRCSGNKVVVLGLADGKRFLIGADDGDLLAIAIAGQVTRRADLRDMSKR